LGGDQSCEILAAARLGNAATERRDATQLALGVATSCRRCELSGLNWAKWGTGSGVIELTDEGATITLFVSKSSQAEEPECIHDHVPIRWLSRGPSMRTPRGSLA
jgi:hypothetical protein